jgi:zinc D-Ala-D-Ala carboxypeptidase
MKLKYFNDEHDFKGNMDKMDSKLLGMLDALRAEYGFPIQLTSSYRSPDHPIEAAKREPGEHAHGCAVDIVCIGGEATLRLVKAALKIGFLRIGVSRKKNFVHLGIGYSGAPKMTMWTY